MADILIVDDLQLNREFLATLLRYADHEVREAMNGAEALEAMHETRPDLVITDILMPLMDGAEFARRVAANPELASTPIIFYTATYRLADARELASACGVSTVIGKPSEPQTLLDAVHGELGLPLSTFEPSSTDGADETQPATSMRRLQTEYMQELAGLRAQIQTSVRDLAPPLNGEVEQRRQIATQVDDSFMRTQALSMRLATLVELGIDLAGRELPAEMLSIFCRAACDVLNAKIGVACILDESGGLREFASCGLTADQTATLRAELVPTAGLFGELLRDGEPRRRAGIASNAEIGLPAGHPRIGALLAARVASKHRSYGWYFVADRIGSGEFPAGDEQIAGILAVQLATDYENRVLLDRVRRHAALLEVEIGERKEATGQLRESELRFRQLAENIREVFFLLDAETGEMLYVSPAYAEVWQRSVESLLAQPQSWLDAVHPEDRAHALRHFAQTRTSGEFNFEYRLLRPDGTTRWIKARGFPIRDGAGAVYRIAGIAEDITEAKVQDLSIRRLSRILKVLSSINSAIVRTHEREPLLDEACRIAVEEGGFPIAWVSLMEPEGIRVAASRGLDERTLADLETYLRDGDMEQWSPAREALHARQVVVHRELRQTLNEAMGPVAKLALERGYGSVASLPLLPNDDLAGVMVLYATEAEFFDDEEIALLNELAGDIAFALQYIEKEERLSYLAYYDSLTGLPNGILFHERLSQLLERHPKSAALFLLDIDRFTQLNDSLGRHSGDRLLVKLAERLRETVPEPNYLARVGADAFAVATASLRHETEAGTLLQERVLAAVSRPFDLDGTELRISARAGAAVYPADGPNAETLFKNAEAALVEAKTSNARYLFYSPQLNARIADDLALEQQLLAALDRQEFLVYYQPKVAAKSGELVGLEALLRWQSPEGGIVAPDRFIGVLEDTELIIDVGRWVVEKALSDFVAWEAKGLRAPRIAINVSPIQLRYADFPEMILSTLARMDFEKPPIELEITESVIMADIESNTERLQQLNEAGVTIAIDDFGTGYSSLRYLAKLPVDTLKVDRSFVVGMATDADSMTLVSTIIGLAHSFDLTVVAEGVDSEEQAHLLRLMKCDMLQGYLFGKPLPAAQIESLLAQRDQ